MQTRESIQNVDQLIKNKEKRDIFQIFFKKDPIKLKKVEKVEQEGSDSDADSLASKKE